MDIFFVGNALWIGCKPKKNALSAGLRLHLPELCLFKIIRNNLRYTSEEKQIPMTTYILSHHRHDNGAYVEECGSYFFYTQQTVILRHEIKALLPNAFACHY